MSAESGPAAPRIQPPPPPQVTPYRCSTGRPVCGQPAQLTASGWRCGEHRGQPNTTA